MEVKWCTCRAEIALLVTKNKVEGIGEWGECHVEKKLVDAEIKLELTRMEREIVKRKLFKSYGWNKKFYMEMVRIKDCS